MLFSVIEMSTMTVVVDQKKYCFLPLIESTCASEGVVEITDNSTDLPPTNSCLMFPHMLFLTCSLVLQAIFTILFWIITYVAMITLVKDIISILIFLLPQCLYFLGGLQLVRTDSLKSYFLDQKEMTCPVRHTDVLSVQ